MQIEANIISAAVALVIGVCGAVAGFFRKVSILDSRIANAEFKVTILEEESRNNRDFIKSVESKLNDQLIRIETKLDSLILRKP